MRGRTVLSFTIAFPSARTPAEMRESGACVGLRAPDCVRGTTCAGLTACATYILTINPTEVQMWKAFAQSGEQTNTSRPHTHTHTHTHTHWAAMPRSGGGGVACTC